MGRELNREVDKELKNGPLENRECRDLLCCLLFLFNFVVMGYCFIYGMNQGNVKLLMSGFDSNLYGCGASDGYTNYPYLYFPRPDISTFNNRICVSACPTSTTTSISYKANATSQYPTGTSQYMFSNPLQLAQFTASTNTKILIYDSSLQFNRVCIPNVFDYASFSSSISSSLGVADNYLIILASIGVALVVGFIYLCLLKCIAGIIVFVSIMAYLIGLAILGYFIYLKGTTTDSSGNSNLNMTYMAYGIWGFCGLNALIFCCFRKQLALAVAIVKTAGVFLNDVKSVLIVPILGQIFIIVFFAIWVFGFIYIYASGIITGQVALPYATVAITNNQTAYLLYYIFGGLWIHAFTEAMGQFVIASSVAIWYFSQGTGQEVVRPVSRSYYRAFRYHFGSIAFGALLLAIIRTIKVVLYYLQQQVQKAGGDNKVILMIIKCVRCYVECFERFIEFLNKNAYIQIALTGKSFCSAAKDAFSLIMSNMARMAIVGNIGNIFAFLGFLIITLSGAMFTYYILMYNTTYSTLVYSPVISTICSIIICGLVALLVMTVYSMAIDTILQCFILDEQLHLADSQEPQHTPETLRDIMADISKN